MSTPQRYDRPEGWFRRCGTSGLQLPAVSLGFWQNFGAPESASCGIREETSFHEHCRSILVAAFDCGITHFDFANNYGPPPGAAEARCGRILADLPREEIVVSSKAGFRMQPGPYGDGGSRKYLIESCDQSLRRLKLDHLDVFYHHRPDPETPLEETLGALDQIVRSGRALYVGLSNYPGARLREALALCHREGWARPVLHQPKYHMFHRRIEEDLLPVTREAGLGVICFSPLAQGVLTDKYLSGVPQDSRAASASGTLREDQLSPDQLRRVKALHEVAVSRGQSLAQLAIAWVLRDPAVTSALIGASRPGQVRELAEGFRPEGLTGAEAQQIEAILADG